MADETADRTAATEKDSAAPRGPQWPTGEQVLAAIDAVCRDRRLPRGWRAGMMRRLERLRAEVTAHHAVLTAARPIRLGTPGDPDGGGTEHLWLRAQIRVDDLVSELAHEYDQACVRYAWTAQTALQGLAAGQDPDPHTGLLPGEPRPPVHPYTQALVMDDPQVPERYRDRPLLARALGQLAGCDQAARVYDQMFGCTESCHEDPHGCSGAPHIAEHELDAAAELEAEMGRWWSYLGDLGDAIVYTLATELLPEYAGRSTAAAGAAGR